jgi:hypothetical protein
MLVRAVTKRVVKCPLFVAALSAAVETSRAAAETSVRCTSFSRFPRRSVGEDTGGHDVGASVPRVE